jgi:Protein of unknown function (DUF3175)
LRQTDARHLKTTPQRRHGSRIAATEPDGFGVVFRKYFTGAEKWPNVEKREVRARPQHARVPADIDCEEIVEQTVVAASHTGKRRARSQARRLQTDKREENRGVKQSAEQSSRRKAGAYRSALSMLTFYINRAGKTLPRTQRTRFERAKVELKHQFHRD